MEDLGTQKLQTNRLTLRKFELKDAQSAFKNWMSIDEVTKFLTWKTNKNIEDSEKTIKLWLNSYNRLDFYQWNIGLKENNESIGSISLVQVNKKVNSVEVGYCLGNKWWHRGYMKEALNKIIEFSFERLAINRLEGRHDIRNVNSGLVMKKCGLTYEGTLRQADFNNFGIGDMAIYSILREEYEHKVNLKRVAKTCE